MQFVWPEWMTFELLTTVAAWGGLCLSAFNTWDDRRTHLALFPLAVNEQTHSQTIDEPALARLTGIEKIAWHKGSLPAWRIVNTGRLHVEIATVGFARHRLSSNHTRVPLDLDPILINCPQRLRRFLEQTVPLPIRLEAGEAITLLASNSDRAKEALIKWRR